MTPQERLEELLLQWEEAADTGQPLSPAQLCQDCPDLLPELTAQIEALGRLEWMNDLQTDPVPAIGRLDPGFEPVPGYRLVHQIGRGGFGEVWQAHGPDGAALALKFIPWASTAATVEWRSQEILQGIQHPHLLPIFHTWQTGSLLILAMELADRTLLDRWRQARAEGLPGIPRDELLDFFRQAAQALDHLHDQGIQHRDIKPQNLLLQGKTLKVGDLGLARRVTRSITGHTGCLTLAYAPPEFFDGHTSRHSDQYSLAVTYCQMRSGVLPFTGTTAHIVAGHLTRPPDLHCFPPAEANVLSRALAKQPDARWPSCQAFVAALPSDPAAALLPGSLRSPSPRSDWLTRRHMLLLGAGTTSLAGLASLSLLPRKAQGPSEAGKLVPFEPLAPPPNNVRAVAVDSLERRIVLSNRSGGPVLQDSHTGRVLRRFSAPFGPCAALAPFNFSLVLTGHEEAMAILWDLRTGSEIRRFLGHRNSISSVAFSPDGSKVLTSGCDRTVRLWDRPTGEQLACLTGHEGIVTTAVFDPTGRYALSTSWDGTARLWDLTSGTNHVTFTRHRSQVFSAAFSPDGQFAITGSLDRTARVWDPHTGEQIHCLEGHDYGVRALLVWDKSFLVTAGGDNLFVWDLIRGQRLYHSPAIPSTVQSIACLIREERTHLLLGTEEHGLHLWQLPS